MAFPSSWSASVFHAAAACAYVMRRRALQHGLGPLPSAECGAGPVLGHCVPLYLRKNQLASLPRRRPEEEHLLLKREQQVLYQWQDYEQQERHSKSTTFERQVEEPQRNHPPLPIKLLHTSPVRHAPKRKGSGTSAAGTKIPGTSAASGVAAGAGHIFNIYKDILEDHKLLPYDAYPRWLLTLGQPEKSYGELAFTFLYGVGIESATLQEYMRFVRLHTKNIIKLNNMRLKKAKRSSVKPIYYDV